MQIYVNNKLAALKKGTSFEYVSENRMFSGSDGYTLTITFPLKDCPQNLAIFGHINRADVVAQKVIFDCEIRDRGFYKFGCITVTEINEAEVKTQFLDGRSEQNFDKTFDKVYINELDLGQPPTSDKEAISPEDAWNPKTTQCEAVALPWVNNASGNIQNCTVYEDGAYRWHKDTTGLSWQPYLLFITKRICEAVGYSFDFSEWEARPEYKYILICNSIPNAWDISQYARALPHWTVDEFFAKLELFFNGAFDINHRSKHISFNFSIDAISGTHPIALSNIVAEFKSDIDVDVSQCEYIACKNIAYKSSSDDPMWKFYSCAWFIDYWYDAMVEYDTLQELISDNKKHASSGGAPGRGSNMDKLLYAKDVDCYFLIRAVSRIDTGNRRPGSDIIVWRYKFVLQPLNLLGPRVYDESKDAVTEEIELVPVKIDFTDDEHGNCMFIPFTANDDSDSEPINFLDKTEAENFLNSWFYQSRAVQTLESSLNDSPKAYFDIINIAWWDGDSSLFQSNGLLPHPFVEDLIVKTDWSGYIQKPFSFRLNKSSSTNFWSLHQIEPKLKTTFKWLSKSIPDVRSLFLIRGKRYICEKITATFTENGMSQLLKGIFYPVKD